ncbi:hypothetical protein FOA52_016196 [Chlamydomonas sp. UWO 241]|nr:hypothetical protein FOA52_016196 [Chlamydomonas sp. UWO 241]
MKRFVNTYGMGMALGYIGVAVAKSLIRRIPFLGRATRPVLDLFPTYLIGPALGAVLTYGLEEGDGDLLAARHKIREGVESFNRRRPELESRAQESARAVADIMSESVGGVKKSVDAMGREVTPVLDKASRRLEGLAREAGLVPQQQRPRQW